MYVCMHVCMRCGTVQEGLLDKLSVTCGLHLDSSTEAVCK